VKCRNGAIILPDLQCFAYLALGAIIVISSNVVASSAPLRRATSVISLNGTCHQLVLDGHDLTRVCQPHVANVEYSDGRISFSYVASKDLVATFSGDGRKQIHRGADTAVLPVDTFFTSLAGQPSKPSRVVGTCEFSNPYKGPVSINCRADAGDGQEVAEFTTDGSAPVEQPLN